MGAAGLATLLWSLAAPVAVVEGLGATAAASSTGLSSVAEELQRLAAQRLPSLHAGAPFFLARELAVREGYLVVSAASSGIARPPASEGGSAPEQCVLLDVYATRGAPGGTEPTGVGGAPKPPVVHLDIASLVGTGYASCRFHVLWARGRGPSLDWMPQEPRLCELYDALLVEDEFLMDKWRGSPPSCRVHPLDPHEVVASAALGPIPWEPGGKLPIIDKPLVSFHAYTVYEEEAQTNPQRWLTDPDTWNPYFIEVAREGFLRLCMKKEDCQGDDAPYRLMFWEDVSKEFVSCVARGITPVYYVTPAIHEYVERNVVLVPWRFQTPLEMHLLLQTLSSPEGVLEHGTRVYMTRQSNHILSSLYWRQSVLVRALLTANAARKQRSLLASAASAASPGATSGSALGPAAIAELVVCVASAAANRRLREIVRQTWGRDQLVHTFAGAVRLRVMFFLADTPEAREEAAQGSDVVLLPLEEAFASIWLKTAAIMKFGSDYFQGKLRVQGDQAGGTRALVRFLVKCDDDAFIDIDALASDLLQASPVGLYWGHVMALVEPNRVVGDKYFVPKEVYPFEYYPPYARGMAYALSEDLVAPLGAALGEDRVEPFPYREDVSVGLYLHQLAQLGEVRVVPRQRKDAMPLDFNEHCRGGGQPPIGTPAAASPLTPGSRSRALLVLHRFTPSDAPCLWERVEARRRNAAAGPPDFCSCVGQARA